MQISADGTLGTSSGTSPSSRTSSTRYALTRPVQFVAFDLLRLSETDTTLWRYRRRRAALESLFAARRLSAPWALCPSTADPDTLPDWLTWAAVGMEGVVCKRLDSRYEPSVRGWRNTTPWPRRAVCCLADTTAVGDFGTPAAPQASPDGQQHTHRSSRSGSSRAPEDGADRMLPDGRTRETLNVTLVRLELVVEVGVAPATPPAGGDTRTPAPPPHRPLPHRRPPPGTAVAVTAAQRRRPRSARNTGERPDPGRAFAAHPAPTSPLNSSQEHGRRPPPRECSIPTTPVPGMRGRVTTRLLSRCMPTLHRRPSGQHRIARLRSALCEWRPAVPHPTVARSLSGNRRPVVLRATNPGEQPVEGGAKGRRLRGGRPGLDADRLAAVPLDTVGQASRSSW
ncbi:hypothetical protein ACH49O_30465 [Streptomyces coeruleorubidus]